MKNAERNAEIIRRRKAGHWPHRIAATMNLSRNVVLGVLHRAGLTDPNSAKAIYAPRPGNGGLNVRLLEEQVKAIRRARPGEIAGLARSYGISASHAYGLRCRPERSWAHVA